MPGRAGCLVTGDTWHGFDLKPFDEGDNGGDEKRVERMEGPPAFGGVCAYRYKGKGV